MKERDIISRRGFVLQLLIPIVVVTLALLFGYLYFSNAFTSAPRMEIFPKNQYSETLRVVTDIDYAPFSYVDEDGEYAGLDVELINEIANRLEMNLDLTLMDWNEANEMIRQGEADLIMNMETDLVTPESGMIATIPTTEKQYVVYGRQAVHSVIDLYGTRVASLHQLESLELDITYINSYQKIFEELRDGEFDYAICPIQVGNSFLEKLQMKDVFPSYAVGHVYGALAFPADRTQLCDRINPVLKELQEEGFLDRLDRKWVNHRYEYTTISSVIEGHPVFAAALMAGLLLLVVVGFLFIMTQRRAARINQLHTQQLQENLEMIREARTKAYRDELTGIRNKNAYQELAAQKQAEIDQQTIQPFGIVVCDVNDLKRVNDVQGHKAGDQLLIGACKMICQNYAHSPVFRIGGDEFVAVLTGQDYEDRQALLDRMRAASAANRESGGIVIACGMSVYDGDVRAAAVFERADKDMYHNKTSLKS